MFDNVVVGVRDYAAGRDAVELARALLSDGGELALVYVEPVVGEPETGSLTGADAERQRYGVERLARLRDDAQVTAEIARIQARSVKHGLHEFASSRGSDLIVIGARRGRRLEHLLLGDEGRAVLEDPPCAVALAPVGYCTHAGGIKKIGVAYDGSPESEEALEVASRFARDRSATVDAVRTPGGSGAAVDLLVVVGSQRAAEGSSSPLLVLAGTPSMRA